MNRRHFLKQAGFGCLAFAPFASGIYTNHAPATEPSVDLSWPDQAMTQDWLNRWEAEMEQEIRNRYCDKETGEELGWVVSPFTNGFYYGYMATGDTKWISMLVDWTDSWVNRGVKEPDDHMGWPKGDGGGNESKEYSADSLLGEAMALRPAVLMADTIIKTPALKEKWGEKAAAYLDLANKTFDKWDSRDCWRETKEGGVWVVPGFGVDKKNGGWSAGYATRKTTGFTNPDNKQNHIARWLLAMADATGNPVYTERAVKWFRVMKSRMQTRESGKYSAWNYWEPAGPWDYKPDGSPRHWVGVHPNGGYYSIDLEGIIAAYEHNLVFAKDDIQRLIATNRDYMWNQTVNGAKFKRIDGGEVDARWKNSPGLLWDALLPYDATLRRVFMANHKPDSWGGLAATPWFLALSKTRGSRAPAA
jgi:hypothetical protein